jgi:hypothetical protein
MGKRTVTLLLAVTLAAGSLCFAGDLKPFKGWAQQINTSPMTLPDALTYGFLKQIIDIRGVPLLMQLVTFRGINNVGGESIHENAQIFYWDFVSPDIEFYEASTVTVANGDQIFLNVEGTSSLSTGTATGTDTVVGGTGRFEGAQGSIGFDAASGTDGQAFVVLKGQVTTVGEAKKR